MVECQDSRCGHEERYCHGCCTTNDSIDTCLNHFRTLGNLAQTARFATGKVMALVAEFVASKANPTSTSALSSAPSPASSPASGSSPVTHAPVAAAVTAAVAAIRAELEIDRAAGQVERVAVQAQLSAQAAVMQQQAAAMQQLLALMATLQALAPAPAVTAPTVPISLPVPPVPPPHQQSLLGASPIEQQALIDRILQGPAANAEVSHRSHIVPQSTPPANPSVASWLNPLPEALIPSLPGSERDNSQILTSIITGLKAREVKYTTLAQLDTALGDWWDLTVTTWTGKQLNSLMLYRRFVIDTLGKRSPLHSVVKYHTLWTKAVNTRKHDMFADDGHIHLAALIEAEIQLGPVTSTFPTKGKKTPAASDSTARKEGEIPKKVHAAGSCTHHPESVTHTTAQCKHPK